MYCYFSADYPAAIKINGVYFGRCDGDALGIRIDDNAAFIEVCPLYFGAVKGFLLGEKFLCAPPKFVSITDLKGGYLIRISNQTENKGFKVVAQENFNGAVITVFFDGTLKASIETAQGFIYDSFGFASDSAVIYRSDFSEQTVATVFFKEKKIAYYYGVSGKPVKLGSAFADSVIAENGLTTVYEKKDMAKHKIKTVWGIKEGALAKTESMVTVSEKFDNAALPAELIPYGFLEELAVGGDYPYYLSENVKKNADKLKSYLGEYLFVMPPPPFRRPNEIGLIYKTGENRYSVDYVTVETENGKIVNLKRSET